MPTTGPGHLASCLVGALLLGLAVLVFWFAALLADGTVSRNHALGIRLPSLLRSDQAWREGHRAARGPLRAGAAGCGILAVVSAALGGSPTPYVVVVLGAVVVLLAGVAVATFRAQRAASAAAGASTAR
jgi:hypothetical protein